ncbi:hypothetical protein WR25_07417 [Diploscapter pachys]|uniref:Uncharacterized protein n=1 Tax=Diploscapter pachys TaxID=2018661 RepID=A0A2A2M3M8_9BILA|nr:hypothetical protein WR25_07417 [Diploscapter pachys]
MRSPARGRCGIRSSYAGQVDVIGVEAADRHDLFDLGDADPAGGGHRLVEVARGLAEDQVAALVRLPALDDAEVGADAAFEDIILTVEGLHLLALGHQRADAGLGVEARDARAPCPAAFGERALRTEFHLQLAGEILAFELLVLADVARDHLLDLAAAQQLAEAFAIDAGIVAGDRQILDARGLDRVDQPFVVGAVTSGLPRGPASFS